MIEDVIAEHPPPAPVTDDYSRGVIDEAVATLGSLRSLQWLGHGPGQLHLLASLRDQIDQHITEAIALALDQDYTRHQISRLLGHTTTKHNRPRPTNTR